MRGGSLGQRHINNNNGDKSLKELTGIKKDRGGGTFREKIRRAGEGLNGAARREPLGGKICTIWESQGHTAQGGRVI